MHCISRCYTFAKDRTTGCCESVVASTGETLSNTVEAYLHRFHSLLQNRLPSSENFVMSILTSSAAVRSCRSSAKRSASAPHAEIPSG